MGAELLHYRPWRGELGGPGRGVWAIARVGLRLIFRRKVFWALYALGLFFFLLFFFGQYLMAWAETQAEPRIEIFRGVSVPREELIGPLRRGLRLDGSPALFRTFFWWQGYTVMIVLALAGSVLVGNDFRFGSLPFYLSKPLDRWHYLLGKCLAVAVFVNLMTTLPALVLYAQYGLLTTWSYFSGSVPLLLGILAYGAVLTVCLSILLVATASWLRRTVPMIMAWTTLFVLLRLLSAALVDGLHYSPRWRLLDLWNNLFLVGNVCLGVPLHTVRPAPQPDVVEAALVLTGGCLLCLSYLNLRIRAVEVVH
jgi:ABC-type transport system involved in multi-copper enzyme maturation permease subunit